MFRYRDNTDEGHTAPLRHGVGPQTRGQKSQQTAKLWLRLPPPGLASPYRERCNGVVFAGVAGVGKTRLALGGPVDHGLVRRLVERTQGNIMFIRGLVLRAVEDGSLRNEGGLWRQIGPIRPSDRLAELAGERLSVLSPAQHEVLEPLAL